MAGPDSDTAAEFHWQSFFEDAADPLFFLSRRRRLLFVNRAWETATGWSAAQVRGLLCSRRTIAAAGPMEDLARVLCPPPGVLQGKSARARRTAPGPVPHFWDLAYSPLLGPEGVVGILGRIQGATAIAGSVALPSKLVALRERLTQRYQFGLLPNSSLADRRLAEQAQLASRSKVGVLIVGEPGSGKQWLARAIHYEGWTRDRGFVALACGRLPAPALAEMAFGEHGLLRRADVGALYLNDLAALPRDLQQRFAAFFVESSAGGPRLIGACTSDPAEDLRNGRLLEELYAVVSTLTLSVPPLRERRASLRELVQRLLQRAGEGEEGPISTLAPDAWELLDAHTWPANLRELYTVLALARIRAGAAVIEAAHLPTSLRQAAGLKRTGGRDDHLPRTLDELLEEVERRLIQLALQRNKGNKSKAAKWLGIWRPRLLRRMEALGIKE